MTADLPPDRRKAEIARIAAHLADLAEQQGPLLFLAELEAILGDATDLLSHDLAAIFARPSDISPPSARYDWQAQERLLSALVATRFAA